MFLLTVLVVFYAAALNTVAHSRKMRYENLAYHIANKQMEVLRTTTFDSLPPSNSFADALLSQLPSSSANFTVTDHATYTGVKELVVTVGWNDGIARTVVLRTLAGSGGINP